MHDAFDAKQWDKINFEDAFLGYLQLQAASLACILEGIYRQLLRVKVTVFDIFWYVVVNISCEKVSS